MENSVTVPMTASTATHPGAQQWDQQVQSLGGSFLQSYAWGEFQQQYGRSVDRFSTANGCAQTVVHTLPLGRSYLFTPYGPCGDLSDTWQEHLQELREKYQALFWRYERGGAPLGGQKVASIHPSITTIVSLSDKATMSAGLKQKWRYNIGLAKRKGVTVRQSGRAADVTAFYGLLLKTAERQGISLHPQRYYETMAATLAGSLVQYYFAEYQGRVIATALVARFHDTVTYVHGGADHAERAVMAPHLLHWKIMCDAAEAGYKHYDLFGIAPLNQPNHPWAGITQFKLGFGGRIVEYPGTFERALQPAWYTLYRLIKRTHLWT